MEYICINNETIEKYEVTYDTQKLLQLRKDIINNSSYITHEVKQTISNPIICQPYGKEYKGVSKRIIGWKNVCGEDKPIYEYQYNVYKYPMLVFYIDDLMQGDISSLINERSPFNRLFKYSIASWISAISSSVLFTNFLFLSSAI